MQAADEGVTKARASSGGWFGVELTRLGALVFKEAINGASNHVFKVRVLQCSYD